MRVLAWFLVSACLIGMGRPALAAPLQATPKRSQDDVIYDKVREKLATDRDVKGGGIDVDVHDGVVTLRGRVREDKQKTKAERLARKVKGVKKVINELMVEMPPARKGP